jgi:hypothetical protein
MRSSHRHVGIGVATTCDGLEERPVDSVFRVTVRPGATILATNGWRNVELTYGGFCGAPGLQLLLANDQMWLASAPYVQLSTCFSSTTVGPAPHWWAVKPSPPVGNSRIGPAPMIHPLAVGALGEKNRLSLVSPRPVSLFPGPAKFWFIRIGAGRHQDYRSGAPDDAARFLRRNEEIDRRIYKANGSALTRRLRQLQYRQNRIRNELPVLVQ